MAPGIDSTLDFIRQAHAGQFYPTGSDTPYWVHPVLVMAELGPAAPLEVRLAALLHDVIEDTSCTADELLRHGYCGRTVELVQGLTRPPKGAQSRPSYLDWIRGIAASGDEWLIRIKMADNTVNLRSVGNLPAETAAGLERRYRRSLRILRAALEGLGATTNSDRLN